MQMHLACSYRRKTLVLAVFALTAGCSPEQPSLSPEIVAAQGKARQAINQFQSELKSQLIGAIDAVGPAGAIGVCRTVAPAIGDATSEHHGVVIGRTALKLRNPENAPDDWEYEVLLDFERAMGSGADPVSLSASKVMHHDQGHSLRYMTPIPTGGLCLTCHGDAIAPAISADLARLYPDDQATGFQLGELRGAFTVQVPLVEDQSKD